MSMEACREKKNSMGNLEKSVSHQQACYCYPRPDFARESWESLDGEWEFDSGERFQTAEEALGSDFEEKIQVPFCYQSQASGIGRTEDRDTVWYRREFRLSPEQRNGSVQLHFGAVDYEAQVWVNGRCAGTHRGGHTSFSFDITYLAEERNTLLVKAVDTLACDRPRGKQSWKGRNFGCWYTPTTGIWQSVWLTFTSRSYLTAVKITPNLDALTAEVEVEAKNARSMEVRLKAHYEVDGEKKEARAAAQISVNEKGRGILVFPDYDHRAANDFYWSPEHPNLIGVTAELWAGDDCLDRVETYFGMRKISVHNGQLLLNNRPYFQRLVLDQGYWRDTLLTPPSEEAIKKDIELTKAMGFNGARKHQKIEDPRYYYWADKLGLLVWGEMPSAYEFNDRAMRGTYRELMEFVKRDYNHPCIVCWVPLNESWGVSNIMNDLRQQDYARSLYYMLKALDPGRIVSTNDGWEHVDENDICSLHDYALFEDNLDKYDDPGYYTEKNVEHRLPNASGNRYHGEPVMVTEYGGVAFSGDEQGAWGYYEAARSQEEFLSRIKKTTEKFISSRGRFSGFCYTQLTDVMQEVNGLLDMDRNPKAPLERLKEIFGREFY